MARGCDIVRWERLREREQWDALISLVQTHIVSDQMDRWLWSADGSGVFSVSMARVLIDKGTLVIGEEETRWSKLVPIKINVFIWRMILDKLPTRLNLMLRGLDVQCNLWHLWYTHREHRSCYVALSSGFRFMAFDW
ncbi:hypothetical protein Tco_0840484 [Tanacetum coccineum]|uniref:Reverse transcriptase zinc-binding domain-containing protein n=1 Tax=Tanacetum coccineum TaxID=301880 RepID=A0ABQ5AWC7_9ASTR